MKEVNTVQNTIKGSNESKKTFAHSKAQFYSKSMEAKLR